MILSLSGQGGANLGGLKIVVIIFLKLLGFWARVSLEEYKNKEE